MSLKRIRLDECCQRAELFKQDGLKDFHEDIWKRNYLYVTELFQDSEFITRNIAKKISQGLSSFILSPGQHLLLEDRDLQSFLYIIENGYDGGVPLLNLIKKQCPKPEFTVYPKRGKSGGIVIEWEEIKDVPDEKDVMKYPFIFGVVVFCIFLILGRMGLIVK